MPDIDFACKQFDITDIIKCALGLSRKECRILRVILDNNKVELTSDKIAVLLGVDKSTVQRTLKRMTEKGILLRKQKNLDKGGFIYVYEISDKEALRKKLLMTIKQWELELEKSIKNW